MRSNYYKIPFLIGISITAIFLNMAISFFLPFSIEIFLKFDIRNLTLLNNDELKQDFVIKPRYDPHLTFSELTHRSPQYMDEFVGISIMPFNRLGNDFYQFLRAIQYCDTFGWNYVSIPHNFLGINHNFKVKNITIIADPKDVPSSIFSKLRTGHFFYQLRRYKIDLDFRYTEYLKDHISFSFNEVNLTENDLVIHIRSGDIFNDDNWPSNYYAQPPLQFYLDIIKSKNWTSVKILSENKNNPCVEELMKLGYDFHENSFEHDLSLLLQAQNLAIGQGTIGIAIVFLSKKLKNLYTFNQESGKMMTHWNCNPDEAYQNMFLDKDEPNIPISKKKEMYETMMTSKCNWSQVQQYSNTKFVWRDGDG